MLTEKSDIQEVKGFETVPEQTHLSKMMRMEWIGQTLASLFWIVSVFAYGGPERLGNWLQLKAEPSWLLSDIAAMMK